MRRRANCAAYLQSRKEMAAVNQTAAQSPRGLGDSRESDVVLLVESSEIPTRPDHAEGVGPHRHGHGAGGVPVGLKSEITL